jgi:hypothetical protein
MRSKFIVTVAASLLAGTIAASAQTGQPNEKGVDQKTDDAATSATPNRPSGPQGTVGSGAAGRHLAVGAAAGRCGWIGCAAATEVTRASGRALGRNP